MYKAYKYNIKNMQNMIRNNNLPSHSSYIQKSILVLDAMLTVSLTTCCAVGTDGNWVFTFRFLCTPWRWDCHAETCQSEVTRMSYIIWLRLGGTLNENIKWMNAQFYRFNYRLLRLNSPVVTSRLRTITCFDSLTLKQYFVWNICLIS
jgi:hypothetical protein